MTINDLRRIVAEELALSRELKTSHATCLEHVAALRQSGLVVRYAIVRSASGCRSTLWASTRLRLTLPAPPPCPPPPPRRRNRSVKAPLAIAESESA